MLGGLDPRKMQALMKQMGIKQEEINAERVIIEKADSRIIIEPANVIKMTMQGKENWQITGEAREENNGNDMRESDITIVMEKTGKNEGEARRALEETSGDIAEAILKLSD